MDYQPEDDTSDPEAWCWYVSSERAAGRVVLATEGGLCTCGCREPTSSTKSLFRVGHRAALRRKLTRAHLAGVAILEVRHDARTGALEVAEMGAAEMAARFDMAGQVEAAAGRQNAERRARAERAERAVAARALEPQDGRCLVKIGRWERTGHVLAVYDAGDALELEYVTAAGETCTTRRAKIVTATAEAV